MIELIMLIAQIFQIFIYMFIFFSIFKIFFSTFRRSFNNHYFKKNVIVNKNGNHAKSKKIYRDVTKEKLQMFQIEDINILKDYFFDIFLKFERAYNSLDYNTMKMISTKQLYHNYYTGLSLDFKVGKKIIIYELDSTIAKQTAEVMIEISYINYMINKSGNVISGDREHPITEKFEVVFRKAYEKEDVKKCPNCGASIVGNRCEFCRTTIENIDFKISSIKKIIE